MPDDVMSKGTTLDAQVAETALDVAAQRLIFGPGLYLVTLTGGGLQQSGGLSLPFIRIDPLPPTPQAPGRAHVACLTDGQWLTTSEQSAWLQVDDDQAAVLLTTYNAAQGGISAPQVRIRLVRNAAAAAALLTEESLPASASAELPQLPEPPPRVDGYALAVSTHCADLGDLSGHAGAWVGSGDPRHAIEAFSFALTREAIADANPGLSLEYQAIMGVDWLSPWRQAPESCGSRGLALPILGLRLHLTGRDAARFRIVLWGRSGQSEIGPIASGELQFETGQPLTAIKAELRAVEPAPVPAPERRSRTRATLRKIPPGKPNG